MLIEDAYRHASATWSDIYEHLPTLVDLTLELDARTVIELGVRTGNSTAAWLWGVEQTDGLVWSCDVAEPPAWLRQFHRWTFHLGDDLDPETLSRAPAEADILFVDTSHRYLHTVAEIGAWSPRVRPGGAVVFHDTEVETFGADVHEPGSEPPFPVRKAVDEWTGAMSEAGCQAEVEHHPNNHGLTIVRLPACSG